MRLFWLLLVLGGTVAFAAEWTYEKGGKHGPENWAHMAGNEACGGTKQSPINLSKSAATYSSDLNRFRFTGYSSKRRSMKLENNGHTAKVTLEGNIFIRKGNLSGKYKAAQFHFHWGSTNSKGSEHTINNKQYPMEMHIVHYSAPYGDVGSAADKPAGLAVLGFMFEVTDEDNIQLNDLIDGIEKIPNKGDNITLNKFSLNRILPEARYKYYRYDGSLTTPPCYESVVWTVFTDTIPISERQLNAFRSLNDGAGGKIVNNYRPPQDVDENEHPRSVFVSWQ